MSASQLDPQDMKQAIYDFADNLRDAMAIGQGVVLKSTPASINNVVVAGMGGSAIGGNLRAPGGVGIQGTQAVAGFDFMEKGRPSTGTDEDPFPIGRQGE